MPGPDELTAYLFDSAVEYLGRWIDHKANQTDDKGALLYSLDDLLADKAMTAAKVSGIMGVFGGDMVSLDALLKDPAYIAQVDAGLVTPPPNWPSTQH